MAVPGPGAPYQLGNHADPSSASPSTLLSKVKRQFSLNKKKSGSASSSTSSLNSLREHLPKGLGGTTKAGGGGDSGPEASILGGPDVDEPTAYTIAPPEHREVRHARNDPSWSTPSRGPGAH